MVSYLGIIAFARITTIIIVTFLLLIWLLLFKTSFLSNSSSSQHTFIYDVLHPLLMVIGFIIISGEAILVHRWMRGSRNVKKSIHLGMQGVALACGVFGIWTKFYGNNGILSNFYSLHSWMGLLCISLFAIQWTMGFVSFWHRGEVRSVRMRILPWHVFVGLYTYGLAVATAETGLLEKLTFIQANRNVSKHGYESMLVNGLGLGLALLSGVVILAAVSPKQHQSIMNSDKLRYSNDKY